MFLDLIAPRWKEEDYFPSVLVHHIYSTRTVSSTESSWTRLEPVQVFLLHEESHPNDFTPRRRRRRRSSFLQ